MVKYSNSRRSIGLGSMVLFLVTFFVFCGNISPCPAQGSLDWTDTTGILLLCAWIPLSFSVKFSMVIGKKINWLNTSSVVIFLLLISVALIGVVFSESTRSGTGLGFWGEILFAVVIWGWPVIDFIDWRFGKGANKPGLRREAA